MRNPCRVFAGPPPTPALSRKREREATSIVDIAFIGTPHPVHGRPRCPFSKRSPIASSFGLVTMFSPRCSKWYSWIDVSTIESTGQLSSQKPQ